MNWYLSKLLVLETLRNNGLLLMEHTSNSTFGKRAFSVAAMPFAIRNIDNINSLKKELKTCAFFYHPVEKVLYKLTIIIKLKKQSFDYFAKVRQWKRGFREPSKLFTNLFRLYQHKCIKVVLCWRSSCFHKCTKYISTNRSRNDRAAYGFFFYLFKECTWSYRCKIF